MNSKAKLEQYHNSVPNRIAHIGIMTKQFETMLDWYQRFLLAEPVYKDDNLAFISFDEEHHRVVLMKLPDEAPENNPNGPGMAHLAYTFSSIKELLGAYERLRNEGIVPFLPINHGMTTSMYYMDPDGNQMEFQWDNFETLKECKEYFFSDAFLANPVGHIYDPEILLEGVAAGNPLESVMKQAIDAGDQSILPPKP